VALEYLEVGPGQREVDVHLLGAACGLDGALPPPPEALARAAGQGAREGHRPAVHGVDGAAQVDDVAVERPEQFAVGGRPEVAAQALEDPGVAVEVDRDAVGHPQADGGHDAFLGVHRASPAADGRRRVHRLGKLSDILSVVPRGVNGASARHRTARRLATHRA